MLPSSDDTENSLVVNKVIRHVKVRVEPVGRWYEAHCLRKRQKQTLSELSATDSTSSDQGESLDETDEIDETLLLALDPSEWKNQDHYAVLGLKKIRWKASEDQIKKAYKQKVLRHHPDKRRARGLKVKEGEEDYFTCITRAYEVLGNPTKRRSFDSVDPEFDDSVPSNSTSSKEQFYSVFRPAFERNARFSRKKNVPILGDESSSYDDVCHFYSFWYDFDSWREYSYLDEEEKEKGENRDERRWIEKQNKAARLKRKKEETIRMRQLVDNAYACDPRIQRFKDEEKEKKLAIKRAKQEAARAKAEEEEKERQKVLEEERKKREKEEEESKALAAIAKKDREAQKKIIKKERKTLRTASKDLDYFTTDETERISNMTHVDKLADMLSLASLQSLNQILANGDPEKSKEAFLEKMKEVNDEIEKEKQKMLASQQKQVTTESSPSSKKAWREEELQMLIKGVNLFPAGTKERWEVIANFISQHVDNSHRSAKEVLGKAKELQKNDTFLKQEATKKAYEKFEKDHKASGPAESEPSQRVESIAEQQIRETGTNPAPWTVEEQKRLEQALKTYSSSTPDRWERIAEVLPSRSKKDCMKRYKELVEMVRAKKSAQDAAAKQKKT